MGLFDRVRDRLVGSRLEEEAFYEAALNEIEHGGRRPGIWAKALSRSKGNQEAAKGLYVQLLVKKLKDEEDIRKRLHEERSRELSREAQELEEERSREIARKAERAHEERERELAREAKEKADRKAERRLQEKQIKREKREKLLRTSAKEASSWLVHLGWAVLFVGALYFLFMTLPT